MGRYKARDSMRPKSSSRYSALWPFSSARTKRLGDEVEARPVRILDDNLGGARLEQRVHDRIDLVGQQPPAISTLT
jgi:hypothetical protein